MLGFYLVYTPFQKSKCIISKRNRVNNTKSNVLICILNVCCLKLKKTISWGDFLKFANKNQ